MGWQGSTIGIDVLKSLRSRDKFNTMENVATHTDLFLKGSLLTLTKALWIRNNTNNGHWMRSIL